MEKTVENSTPQQGKKAPHRGVYVLPNLITSLSMFMGFLCMVWAVQGRFEAAVCAVFLSALLDGMDGKVARLTGTASEFGVQYDSLADLVAFGVAPAMLMWQWQLEAFGRWGEAAAFIYAACGALRLARFNVSTTFVSKRFFIGLPIPAGGCTLATFVLFSGMLPDFFAPAVPYVCFLLVIFPSRNTTFCVPTPSAPWWGRCSRWRWSTPSRGSSPFSFALSTSPAASSIRW